MTQNHNTRLPRKYVPAHVIANGASPGVYRIEQLALQDLEKHDSRWRHRDRTMWQTWYSLLKHCTRVGQAMKKLSEENGTDIRSTNLSHAASILHDVGKIHKQCEVYRLLKVLNKKERAMIDLHPIYSADYLEDQLKCSRAEDHPFLKDAMTVVHHHHRPWRILDRNLRGIAWNLKAVDILVSLQEERWRPGLSQEKAVETFPLIMCAETPLAARIVFRREISASIKSVSNLFGARRHRSIIA